MNKGNSHDAQPWWRFGHVWMVIAGPAIVVVAGLTTFYLAASSPNEIVSDEMYRQNVDALKQKGLTAIPADGAPALQARNHGATGAVPIVSK